MNPASQAAKSEEPQSPAPAGTDRNGEVNADAGWAIRASGLTATGPEGPVFENVSADVPAGGVLHLIGPARSGRTALLLALTGRLRLVAGQAVVGPYRLSKDAAHVRRCAAVAGASPAVDLDEHLTVEDHLTEWRITNRRLQDQLDDACALFRGHLEQRQRKVGELHPLDQLALQLALALAGLPKILAVDDVDRGLGRDQAAEAWELVERVHNLGITLITGSHDAPRRGDRMTRIVQMPQRTQLPDLASPAQQGSVDGGAHR